MRKALIGFVIALLIVGAYFLGKKTEHTTISDSGVLQEKLKNVSKLIVTEGHFSDVITYKDAKEVYLSWIKAEKKAVVLVNAKATVSYNLKELEFKAYEATQTITITKLPEPELQIYPKLEYYDIQADFLNEFTPKDYNKISEVVDQRLRKQIEKSTIVINAQNRLISELHSLLNKEGLIWRIEYAPSNEVLLD